MKYLQRAWRIVRWPLGVLVLLYVGLAIYRIPAVEEKERTAQVVAQIHAQKITLADVMGRALPSMPDEQENNATVAGIDKNNNGVRDDVELAIFKKYPNSAKIRAAELQYAMALQLMVTKVFNVETWVAAAEEISRGDACIGSTVANNDLKVYLAHSNEIKNLILNTSKRRDAWEGAYNFTSSFGLPDTNLCNVDLGALPN